MTAASIGRRLVLCALLGACSHQQMYQASENWREEACQRSHSRHSPAWEHCMASARLPYEDYQRELDAARQDADSLAQP